jgi:hypothetical protein
MAMAKVMRINMGMAMDRMAEGKKVEEDIIVISRKRRYLSEICFGNKLCF